jgi:hypothetical protein
MLVQCNLLRLKKNCNVKVVFVHEVICNGCVILNSYDLSTTSLSTNIFIENSALHMFNLYVHGCF